MSDELERLIAAERAAPPQPPVGADSVGWERLKRSAIVVVPPAFDVPPPVVETVAVAKTGVGLGLVGKVIATVAVATATTTTAIVVTRSEPVRAPIVAKADVGDEPRTKPAHAPTASTRSAAIDAPSPVAPPPVEPAIVAPPIAPEASPELAAGERLRKPKSAATPAVTPTTDAPDEGKLERERALVSAAQRALAEKRPARALDVLDDHARTFPHGAMAEDRDALRVVALCLAGRTADAETSRTKFFRRWPKSLHASRVRKACDEHG